MTVTTVHKFLNWINSVSHYFHSHGVVAVNLRETPTSVKSEVPFSIVSPNQVFDQLDSLATEYPFQQQITSVINNNKDPIALTNNSY